MPRTPSRAKQHRAGSASIPRSTRSPSNGASSARTCSTRWTGDAMDPTGVIAQRFPLVPRIRPLCLPLPDRIAGLTSLAEAAVRDADHRAASSVLNQAALLASDLNLPDLARQWCYRHANAYLTSCPLNG